MQLRRRQPFLSLALASALLLSTGLAGMRAQAEPSKVLRAHGVALLPLTFETRSDRWHIRLEWSRDGETFYGAPIAIPFEPFDHPVMAVMQKGDETQLLVVATGSLTRACDPDEAFLFPEAGTYYLRWTVSFRIENESADPASDGEPPAGLSRELPYSMVDHVIEQEVRVAEALPSDREMLERLGRLETTVTVFGHNIFEEMREDLVAKARRPESIEYRALPVIATAVRAANGPQGSGSAWSLRSVEQMRRWGDTLVGMTREIPDSTYTPYLAYLAGRCHLRLAQKEKAVGASRAAQRDEEQETRQERCLRTAAFMKQDPDALKAEAALELALGGADEFLKPRVLIQLSRLASARNEFEKAERLLAEAGQAAVGDRSIAEASEVIQRSIANRRADAAGKPRPPIDLSTLFPPERKQPGRRP